MFAWLSSAYAPNYISGTVLMGVDIIGLCYRLNRLYSLDIATGTRQLSE